LIGGASFPGRRSKQRKRGSPGLGGIECITGPGAVRKIYKKTSDFPLTPYSYQDNLYYRRHEGGIKRVFGNFRFQTASLKKRQNAEHFAKLAS
jgi:hypothetical protein